jgi:hypothetical protein
MMGKQNNNKGNLVYLPSSVRLYQFDDKRIAEAMIPNPNTRCEMPVVRHTQTTKPMNVLSLGNKFGEYVEVLYNAEKWCVKIKDVYEVRS